MYESSFSFPMMDYWTNDLAVFPTVNSADDPRSGVLTSPDSRTPSPEWPTAGSGGSFFDNYAGPRSVAYPTMQRCTSPREQVAFSPKSINEAWQALSKSEPAYEKPPSYPQPVPGYARPPTCPPRRFCFEATPCCSAPRLRIFHECCNKETKPHEIVDERPPNPPRRNFPPISTKITLCRFCLKNGEPPSIYYSHNLHSGDGRVSCPVLRRYDCPVCNNGGGDYAHTVRYCPTLKASYARGQA